MRIAVPDLVSNSYFPAVAAVELGFFAAEGLEAELQLIFPVPRSPAGIPFSWRFRPEIRIWGSNIYKRFSTFRPDF